MTKADSQKASSAAGASMRIRGPYATRACDVCRRKKIRCDEIKPVCGSCASSQRHSECTWTRENVRAPRTEAQFEALRKRVEALQAYVDVLEPIVEKCRREHGTHISTLQRPTYDSGESSEELPDDPEVVDSDICQDLSAATMNLTLDDRDLVVYSSATPFRFISPNKTIATVYGELPEPDVRLTLVEENAVDELQRPPIEWNRYLPATPLTRREHDRLLDLLFKYFTSWCLRVIPVLFLRDMYRTLAPNTKYETLKTPHYSPMLHNVLLALACAFSDDPAINDVATRDQFAKTAKWYIDFECARPNICGVQALSLLGSYHSTKGEPNLGYVYHGSSLRLAQILGLSINCSSWVKSGAITHQDMLDRNWCHWTALTWDVCWSFYIGRDCTVPSVDDVPVPISEKFDSIPWKYQVPGLPPQPSYISRVFMSSCELCTIVRRIMDNLNKLGLSKRNSVTAEEVLKLDLQLRTWFANLPEEISIKNANKSVAPPHQLMMHMLYWLAFILLHRSFLRKTGSKPPTSEAAVHHSKICKCASDNILDLAGAWKRLYKLRFAPPTFCHALFSAGTVYIILGTHAAAGPRLAKLAVQNAFSKAATCVEHLREVGRSWVSARNIGEILDAKLQERLADFASKLEQSQEQWDHGRHNLAEQFSGASDAPAAKVPNTHAFNEQLLWPEIAGSQLPDFSAPSIFTDANFANNLGQMQESLGVLPEPVPPSQGFGTQLDASCVAGLFDITFDDMDLQLQPQQADATGSTDFPLLDDVDNQRLWDQIFTEWGHLM